ncbi:TIR domain-containing protein [Chromohalobacter sp. TMW 2.2308]|uniref:TIR domain-containing protein n=1 Tax=Chromohalobacter TaxID=42054 RepID=UPI001FFD2AE7|nr:MULTISPECIES: TIR domain-containing protein [Chromohalobacter]MCK2043626.1 TIR domain-containing protein [Chromohalobacter moromii]MCT8516249.1 TIR domain-containing protein [Chromohalobacter sp. TMW 2.2271]
MARFNPNQINQKIRQAQRQAEQKAKQQARQAEQKLQREVDKVNRENKRKVDAHNRRVEAHNRKVVSDYNAGVRKRNTHNKKVIAELNRQLRSSPTGVRYTEPEQQLADRVHTAVGQLDPREYDTFLSYARIDGGEVASALRDALEELGVAVWFDEVAIVPGRSQSLQMDAGLQKARSGIALLTPAYLTGRFWTERELGALLSKNILIPVLHNATFEDVKKYSGILPDLAGFTTEYNSVEDIAKKIAAAVIPEEEE